ncbi:MAG: hypothetical protein ACOYMB_04755 [Patescibacteria group bacterium]
MSETFISEKLINKKEEFKISFNHEDLLEVFDKNSYQPEKLIALLWKDLGDIYESDADVFEGYTIGEHTLMVLKQFEKYYEGKELPANIDKNFFRFLLAIHDIGKKEAIKNGDKNLQHQFTVEEARPIFKQLNSKEEQWKLFEALIGAECLGQYLKGESINEAFSEIVNGSKKANLSPEDFLAILEIFYKVDAGSYTLDAGGQESLDELFDFDQENKILNFSKETADKYQLLKDKVAVYQNKKELNEKNIESNELYKKVLEEASKIVIPADNYNEKKELLANNGQLSNLSEQEWKMTRTPSFKKWFGDWEKNYNPEDLENWLQYQYLRTLEEETIPSLTWQVENAKQYLNPSSWSYSKERAESYKKIQETWNARRIAVMHEISKIKAELVNKNFNPHLLGFGKLFDKNGEPLVLWRGTDYGPNDKGNFVIPKIGKTENHGGVEVGTFLGKKYEARQHHEKRIYEGGESFLYSCFANVNNIKILPAKLMWHSDKENVDKYQKNYDAIIVKEESSPLYKDGSINLRDLVVFDPKNILILTVE